MAPKILLEIMSKEQWKELGRCLLIGYTVVGVAWWWNETSPLGWFSHKAFTKEERDMAHLYQHREFPYPGDKEAVQEFLEKGGAFGTTIGPRELMEKTGDDMFSRVQKEKFQKEAHKLWLRMRHEAIREFQEKGFDIE